MKYSYKDSNAVVYAMITQLCNLSCPHCDVYKLQDNWNKEKFLDQLRKFNGGIVIFGGECSLYPDRIRLLLDDPIINEKVNTITTNLTILDNELLELYKRIPSIGTSWNPDRFTPEQYEIWMNNIKQIKEIDKSVGIIITLTDSLFEYDFNKFLSMLYQLDEFENVTNIKFESLVSPTVDRMYFRRADDFLSKLYDEWNFRIELFNIRRVQDHFFDCGMVKHLYPDGIMKTGCSHIGAPIIYSGDCLMCENASKCKPCQLQKYCTVPYNFAKKVYRDIGNGKIKPLDQFSETKLDLEEIKNVINQRAHSEIY